MFYVPHSFSYGAARQITFSTCIFFFPFVIVCFFPVVILLTSSRTKNDITFSFSLAPIPVYSFLCSSSHFHFPGSSIFSLKIQVLPVPMSAGDYCCNEMSVTLSLSLIFLYFVRTSSAPALWNNRVLLRDVCEASLSILSTLALGDGRTIFNR